MKKFIAVLVLLVMSLFLSCCNCNRCDDDLRTTPVTNNPNIVPNTASVLPGITPTPPPGAR